MLCLYCRFDETDRDCLAESRIRGSADFSARHASMVRLDRLRKGIRLRFADESR